MNEVTVFDDKMSTAVCVCTTVAVAGAAAVAITAMATGYDAEIDLKEGKIKVSR